MADASAFKRLTGIDLDRPGKQSSSITIPVRGRPPIQLPITLVRRSPGPLVLFTGGSHGDEFEGPTALFNLARELTPSDLKQGGVILMPVINPPAIAAGTRNSPIDGKNLNRVFPGKAKGTACERIAHAIVSGILPHVVALIDLHAGGQAEMIVPSMMVHKFKDPGRMQATLAMMRAFCAPVGIVIKEFETPGMIGTTAERMGLLFGVCELGGAGMMTPETVAVAETGVRNILKHFEIMPGDLEVATWCGSRHVRVAEALSGNHYVFANAAGIFEPFIHLNQRVAAGEALGQIHYLSSPRRAPAVQRAKLSGFAYVLHSFGLIERRKVVAIVAKERRRSTASVSNPSSSKG